jgi:nitrile hydratase accessory protein
VAGMPKPSIDADGPGAPPRRNGELIFQAPWEGRAFGLAVALRDRGVLPWEAFRTRLIAAIAASDARPAGADRPSYYENWLAALQNLLVDSGLLAPADIDERVRQFERGDRDIVTPGAPEGGSHARPEVRDV